jgi:REP element-mobilizing transposase RayT
MSRPPRIDGFSYVGFYRYFLTFCTFDRRDTFTDIALGQSVVRQFRRTSGRWKFALLAYCLMPDHAHLLVEGTSDTSDLRLFIKSAKQSSGQRFAAHLGLARSPLDYPLCGSEAWSLEELIDSLW